MEKTVDKLNRIDILNFTNAVLSISDQFESVQTDLEENGLYSLIPTEYREEYFDYIEKNILIWWKILDVLLWF